MLKDFHYEDGKLFRKGVECGFKDNHGYLRVSVGGRKYLVHRLIYKLTNPEFDLNGDSVVDHINRDRLCNFEWNLREVTKAANNRNRAPCKGVSYCKQTGKWKAGLDGKWLGRHNTEQEAINVVTAERKRQNHYAAQG